MSGVVFSRYFLVQNFSQSLMTGVTKSVRFLPSITPFAGVRGATYRGGCVRRPATTSTRIPASTSSDFVLPGSNPLPSLLFPFSKDPCVGQGGVSPPAPPEAETPWTGLAGW